MENQDDIKNNQALKAINDYLKANKNDKGDTFSKDEIELLRYSKKLIVKKLEIPTYLIEWPDGSKKPTKISVNDGFAEIIPESEDKIIYGQCQYSPDKRYLVVFEDGFWTEHGKNEKYTNGRVYLFEEKKKCLWQKEFISPTKTYVSNHGHVFVIDSFNTNIDKGYVSGLFMIDTDGTGKFTYMFKSRLDKVLYSQKRNELICLTYNPERSFYLFDLSSNKVIHKAKLQRVFKKWFFENANYPFQDDHINIWREDLFKKIRERILEEENIKAPSDNQVLSLEDLKFESERTTEEYERKKYIAIFTKPEFKIFEEYECLKCEAEGKEFKGKISNFYFDYLQAMGIKTLDKLLNTNISILTKKAENTFFHPGPGKIYGINDVIANKFGRELKGIGDYIPVSERVKNELAKIGIHKLGDCLNHPAKKLLKVKGLGGKILANINSALRKYHRRTLKNSERF